MIRRITLGIAVLVLAGGMVFFSRSDLNRIFLPTATGITAKQVCSLHFISGFTPERARELYLVPLSAEAAPLIRSRVGSGNSEVCASLLGLYRRRAVYREGVGCSLVHDGRDFDADRLASDVVAAMQPEVVGLQPQRPVGERLRELLATEVTHEH